jgi:hypothetical protein
MNEQSFSEEPGSLWRDQPLAHGISEQALHNRTLKTSSRTRSEILMTLCAALFLLMVMALRFYSISNRLLLLSAVLCAIWIGVTLIRTRGRLFGLQRGNREAGKAEPWATGVEFYRVELENRRKHLANEWLWHGPLVLACIVLVALIAASMVPLTLSRLLTAFPLLAALLLWTIFSVRQRRRQMAEVQRELDEISSLSASAPGR